MVRCIRTLALAKRRFLHHLAVVQLKEASHTRVNELCTRIPRATEQAMTRRSQGESDAVETWLQTSCRGLQALVGRLQVSTGSSRHTCRPGSVCLFLLTFKRDALLLGLDSRESQQDS